MKKSVVFVAIIGLISGGLFFTLPIKSSSNQALAQEYHPDIAVPDEDAPKMVEPSVEAEVLTLFDAPPPLPKKKKKKKKWYSLGGWSGGVSLKKGNTSAIIKKRISLPLTTAPRRRKKKTKVQQRRRTNCPLFGPLFGF